MLLTNSVAKITDIHIVLNKNHITVSVLYLLNASINEHTANINNRDAITALNLFICVIFLFEVNICYKTLYAYCFRLIKIISLAILASMLTNIIDCIYSVILYIVSIYIMF